MARGASGPWRGPVRAGGWVGSKYSHPPDRGTHGQGTPGDAARPPRASHKFGGGHHSHRAGQHHVLRAVRGRDEGDREHSPGNPHEPAVR